MKKLLNEMSAAELIECAKVCIGKGDCFNCAIYGEDSCHEALILALAGKLEELETRWIAFKLAKPVEADEYLVMVARAEKPTTLWYDPDEEAFYEEGFDGETIWYPVTHWAELPEGPEMPREKPRPTVKRCATCRHEDRLGDEERCLDCEKHSLWEQR